MLKMPVAIGVSFTLHVLLLVALYLGNHITIARPNPDFASEIPIINAVAVDQTQVEKFEQQKKLKQIQEQKRLEELQRQKREAEIKRQKEAQERKRKTEENIRKRKEAEQAAIAAREKQKREKAKAEALEKERQRKAADKKKKEEAERKAKEKREREEKARKEAERKKREAEEKAAQERAEQEKALQEQLMAEQAARQAQRNKQVLTEVQKYQSLIKQTIQRNLIVDDSMKGKSCRLNIRLASNGLVTQVKEMGGDTILCRAAKAAVYKADTLPVSKEADVFEKLRNINLTVEPQL